MARIAGVDLPKDKRVEIGLTYIFGIGRKTAQQILEATEVNPDTRVKDLTEDDVSKLREYIDHNVHKWIFSTNSFIVWENFTPSAAETHSTRVLPFSTPM